MTYVGSGRPLALQVIFTLCVMMAISGTLFKVVLLGLTKKEKDKSAYKKIQEKFDDKVK